MKGARAALAALALGLPSAAAGANPSLSRDFQGMSQWLSHELAQGLAFNAGSTFDPPEEVRGYFLQPDLSLGIGRMPLDKRRFPEITVPALNDFGGANLFPDDVVFPNLALHLRLGLPWRGDAYLRFADATTPANYKITPTMTAAVQTNSYGAGLRQHFFGGEGEPTLTVGGHYNHVRGRVRLKGKFLVEADGFSADSDFTGALDWTLNSWGLTAVTHQEFGSWSPFLGAGLNYVSGSVRSRLEMRCQTFLCSDIVGEGSSKAERAQGRWIFGLQYGRPTWSLFANAELKALGRLQYRSYIAQVGAALPFEIGRGPAIFYRKRPEGERARPRAREPVEDEPGRPARRRAEREAPRPRRAPPKENASPEMIFLR